MIKDVYGNVKSAVYCYFYNLYIVKFLYWQILEAPYWYTVKLIDSFQ